MKFFVIANRGALNRKLIEIIGLSTKRGPETKGSTIGFKGSGTKLAAIAALRMGLHTGITSVDAEGQYYLTFDVEEYEIEGTKVRQVHYRYYGTGEDGKSVVTGYFPSNLDVEAFADWDKPIGDDGLRTFKIVREHVCNAYDADRRFTFGETDKNVFAKKGETAVFLGNTEEVRTIFAMPERYFKFCSRARPVATVPGIGQLYPKSEDGKTRLFLMGVLVECTAKRDFASLFDYSLDDKSLLSEERILKNVYEYVSGVSKLFGKLTDLKLATAILEGVRVGEARFEEEALGRCYRQHLTEASAKVWRKAAHAVFGERIALPSQNDVVNSDVKQMYGYDVVQGNRFLLEFLGYIGIPKADDIFPSDPEKGLELVRFQDLSAESRTRFLVAFRIFAEHFPGRAGLPILFYHPLDEGTRKMAGFAGHGNTCFEEIWIATRSPTTLPTMTELLRTLVHESRHCVTKKYDKDREFVNEADNEIVTELLRIAGFDRFENGTAIPAIASADHVLPNFVDPAARRAQKAAAKAASASSSGEDDVDVLIEQLEDADGDK